MSPDPEEWSSESESWSAPLRLLIIEVKGVSACTWVTYQKSFIYVWKPYQVFYNVFNYN